MLTDSDTPRKQARPVLLCYGHRLAVIQTKNKEPG
jgi:hypothetical protein